MIEYKGYDYYENEIYFTINNAKININNVEVEYEKKEEIVVYDAGGGGRMTWTEVYISFIPINIPFEIDNEFTFTVYDGLFKTKTNYYILQTIYTNNLYSLMCLGEDIYVTKIRENKLKKILSQNEIHSVK